MTTSHPWIRAQQVVIFWMRTGHCRLLDHLYKIKIPCTDECPNGTGIRTPEHVLQSAPTCAEQRCQSWLEPVDLKEKLWGWVEPLRRTADFAMATNRTI